MGTTATIEGSVGYRERMLLPPGSVVEVQLEDISRADAGATVLETVSMTPETGPPYAFSIGYDPRQIDTRMRYALRATISHDDRLLFTTNEYIDPFAGAPIDIVVQRVAEPVRTQGPALAGPTWLLVTLAGEPAPPGAGGRPVDLAFVADEGRAGGFSGCNRYSGSYSLEGDSAHGAPLSLGPMAGTMMACPEEGDVERTYLQMLGGVDAYRIDGDTLSLLAGAEVVATFEPAVD